MNARSLFPAVLLLAACSGDTGSALRFEHPQLDLGQLYQYDELDFSMPFVIEGDSDVLLESIEVSCGCTDVRVVVDGKVLMQAEKKAGATPPPEPGKEAEEEALIATAGAQNHALPPGTKGEVRGSYHPEKRLNQQIVGISLRGSMLNSPTRAEIRAFLKPLFLLDPPRAVFGTLLSGALASNPPAMEMEVRTGRPFAMRGWKNVPAGLRIELMGEPTTQGEGAEIVQRLRLSLEKDLGLGVVEQLVSAGTSLGPDLDLYVSWRVVGPVTYGPDQIVPFGVALQGREVERVVKLWPSVPDLVLPKPRATLLGDAASVIQVSVEALTASPTNPEGWVVRCLLLAGTPAGVYNGTLRISYPEGAGLADKELVVYARVKETR